MTQPANQDLAELELERRKSIRAVKRFDSILNNGPESKKKRLADVVRPYAKPSFPEALIRMSIVYRDGYGVDQDLDEAIEWMQKASDAGSEKGAWNLFNLLLQRDGPGDRKRMFELVNAFEGTGSNAMTILLAESYVEGYGTDVNVDKALELLSKVDRESSKKNEIKYKAVLKALQSGQDVKGVIKKANLPESDKKAIKKLLSESENDLLELLIQTYLEQPTDYAGGLESKNAKSTIRSDCQKLLDVLSSTKEWGIIASPRAISRTLNSMIDSSKERGHMSDKGVVPLFVSLEIKNKYLKEQHEGLYVILSYFDKICKTYDIKYFVSCGTLLGAYRHHGFIPWDDDVDLYMMREDFQRLEKLFKGHKILKVNNALYRSSHTGIINKAHQLAFRDKRYKSVRVGLILYDYVRSSDEEDKAAYVNYMSNLRKEIIALDKYDTSKGIRSTRDPRVRKIFDRSEKEFGIVLGGDAKGGVALSFDNPVTGIDKRIFDYEDFFPLRDMKFGPLTIPGPNNPEKVLEHLYGSYMSFPSNMLNHVHFALGEATSKSIAEGIEIIHKLEEEIEDLRVNLDGERTSCRSCCARPRS